MNLVSNTPLRYLHAAEAVSLAEQASGFGYFVFDPSSMRIRFASTGLKSITQGAFNYDSDMLSAEFAAHIHENDRTKFLAAISSASDGDETKKTEFRLFNNNTAPLHLWMTDTQADEPGESMLRIGVVFADAEEFSQIIREMRTPLNGVLGALTLLNDTALSEEQREFLTTAQTCSQELHSLICNAPDASSIAPPNSADEIAGPSTDNAIVQEPSQRADPISSPAIKLYGHILLAEDSHANALIASAFLRKAGAQVDIASNGLEALSATQDTHYDLIFMDVSMPEMDGIEACEKLRVREGWTQSVPIVALTANVSQSDYDACMNAGMDAFLTKPVNRTRLIESAHAMLNHKAHDNAAAPPDGVIDKQIFDHASIEENFADTPELFALVIETFQVELVDRLQSAVTAADAQNLEDLKKIAHALKGAAANVYAIQLSAVSADLEKSASAGDVPTATRQVNLLQKLAKQADNEISSLPFMRHAS